jgi:hypothetical protein
MATAGCRFSALIWSSLLLICLLVASTDSTTIIKTHISTTKITINEQHSVKVFESATTESEPIAARSTFGDPFVSAEEDSPDFDLGKRIAQIDVPSSGQGTIGTGDSKPTSGIPGSIEPESMAGSSLSGGSAKSSSQSRTEPELPLESQDIHSTNVQIATGVSNSNATSKPLTQGSSDETPRTGTLPTSDTAGAGTKPGNNSTSSSSIKLPSGIGRNTTMVATPSSGSKGVVAGTQIPGSFSIPDTQAASLTSAHNISSPISSTTTRSSNTTGSGTSDIDSARLSVKSSLAATSDSLLQPSSTSISDSGSIRNFTALTSGKPRGPPTVVTFSSSTSNVVESFSRSSATSDVLPHTSATGTINASSSRTYQLHSGKSAK